MTVQAGSEKKEVFRYLASNRMILLWAQVSTPKERDNKKKDLVKIRETKTLRQ